ncbi:SigB/SigF/SigG family RNA polymerase sigma factor [Amycolatopsis mongoliensis]|uniref:SigB/SigF/SigG family RNA polymerase sigma factor n=1 Tax=Amycolatopsis mongoliensis TaxID=715475 RepID=A0A9Y2JJ65_9PSEU|nr:SigB/SigF/SigG family RNA polymerase sigma factor [Amycolatopsis sp. 4-36]WIX98704.1 SigB/SigF/SigG family RNA polymerase sigma factor [Amycolatopsis sp. 4-36]
MPACSVPGAAPPLELAEQQATAASGAVRTSGPRPGRGTRRSDDYSQHRPLFDELAALPAGHPGRGPLRERLILAHLPLAEHIATRFGGRGQPRDDLVQVARIGLVKAVDRFEPAQGSDFLSFAVPTVMGEVRRFFRDTGWSMRVPRGLKELSAQLTRGTTQLAQALGRAPTPSELSGHLGIDVVTVREGLLASNAYEASSLDQPAGDGDGTATVAEGMGGLDARIELVDDHETVAPLLRRLPDRERAIVTMRFFDGMSQSQIAARVGVSQMQVSRLLGKILRELREQLAE